MTKGAMSDTDTLLIDEALGWIDALTALVPPDEARPTMTFIILIRSGPLPAYALLRCKERECAIEAALGLHLTNEKAIDAMKRSAGSAAPKGWRFRLVCRVCS